MFILVFKCGAFQAMRDVLSRMTNYKPTSWKHVQRCQSYVQTDKIYNFRRLFAFFLYCSYSSKTLLIKVSSEYLCATMLYYKTQSYHFYFRSHNDDMKKYLHCR